MQPQWEFRVCCRQIRRKDRFDKVYAYIGCYLRRELSFGRSICNADLGLSWLCHVRLLSGYYVARKHHITAPRIPKGGTALFALLAMAGDMGGAFGPSVVGYFSQHAGDNLQAGLLTGCIFPLIMLATLIAMKKMTPEG